MLAECLSHVVGTPTREVVRAMQRGYKDRRASLDMLAKAMW